MIKGVMEKVMWEEGKIGSFKTSHQLHGCSLKCGHLSA